jgi:hypothetical protein
MHLTHWCTIAGTSLASPLIASTFALAGGANGVEYPAQSLYENELKDPITLHDVTSGSNGECASPFDEEDGLSGCTVLQEAASCSKEAICLAREGYDGPTGLGTPDGIAAFKPFSEEAKQKNEEDLSEEANLQAEEKRNQEEKLRAEEKSHTEEKLHAEEKLREEEKLHVEERRREEKKKEEEEKNNAGGSGAGGTSSNGATTVGPTISAGSVSPAGDGSGNPAAATTTPSPGATSSQPTIELTAFALTPTAILALNHTRPKASSVAFAFTISATARVRVTLAKLVRVRGRDRWEILPGTLSFTASKGGNRRHLANPEALTFAGRYRLTLAPQGGTARTLTFRIG